MARARRQNRIPKKHENYKYKSRFCSHADMIDEEKTSELNDEKLVVLHDEHGYYITSRDRLDSGLADPRRYATSRLMWFKKETPNA